MATYHTEKRVFMKPPGIGCWCLNQSRTLTPTLSQRERVPELFRSNDEVVLDLSKLGLEKFDVVEVAALDFDEKPAEGGRLVRNGNLLRLFPGDNEHRYTVVSYRSGGVASTK